MVSIMPETCCGACANYLISFKLASGEPFRVQFCSYIKEIWGCAAVKGTVSSPSLWWH